MFLSENPIRKETSYQFSANRCYLNRQHGCSFTDSDSEKLLRVGTIVLNLRHQGLVLFRLGKSRPEAAKSTPYCEKDLPRNLGSRLSLAIILARHHESNGLLSIGSPTRLFFRRRGLEFGLQEFTFQSSLDQGQNINLYQYHKMDGTWILRLSPPRSAADIVACVTGSW